MSGPAEQGARGDRARIDDILAAIERINGYRTHVEPEPAEIDQGLVRDAVLYNLVVIGEAVGALSQEIRDKSPDVPWTKIKGLRNLLTHRYFHIEMDMIWEVVEASVPALRTSVENLTRDLPGDSFQ